MPRFFLLCFAAFAGCITDVNLGRLPTSGMGSSTGGMRCGDGVVDPGEACDGGGEALDCNEDCTPVRCGDGVINTMAGEDCDDGNVIDGDGCEYTCEQTGPPRFMFVSSQLYTGDLGGLLGADARCQALATAAKLPGTYMAWLSDNDGSPATRMARTTGPYLLPDGTRVANSWAGLTQHNLLAAITMTELRGDSPIGTSSCTLGEDECTVVWTNTHRSGIQVAFDGSCNGWTSTDGTGMMGTNCNTVSWSAGGCNGAPCDSTAALFCVQQ